MELIFPVDKISVVNINTPDYIIKFITYEMCADEGL